MGPLVLPKKVERGRYICPLERGVAYSQPERGRSISSTGKGKGGSKLSQHISIMPLAINKATYHEVCHAVNEVPFAICNP